MARGDDAGGAGYFGVTGDAMPAKRASLAWPTHAMPAEPASDAGIEKEKVTHNQIFASPLVLL